MFNHRNGQVIRETACRGAFFCKMVSYKKLQRYPYLLHPNKGEIPDAQLPAQEKEPLPAAS
ncbi:hypothetical protein D3C75_1129170 [compost metagenome]